jgi:hypothetical protein
MTSFQIIMALAFATSAPANAQDTARAEIVVVGTVHNPTAQFSEETIVRMLERVKPDLILLEFDPSFFDVSGALREEFRNIALEGKSAVAYAKTAGVPLRPFDIEGRNRFYKEHDYFPRETRLNQEISRLHAADALPLEAKLLFESLLGFAAVRDACASDRAEVINSAACDKALERKEHYAFKGFKRIIETTPALTEMTAFWAMADDFWTRRSRAMVDNIVSQTAALGARRVVVLTGFEHRHFLRRELARRGVVVREYFDYRE